MDRKLQRQLLQIVIEDEANKQRDSGSDDYWRGYRDGWEKATEYFEAMLQPVREDAETG